MAKIILHGPEDQTITWMADFTKMTLSREQVGGYRREPDSERPISPAAAEAFWKQLAALEGKGLRSGAFDALDGVVWEFQALDGQKIYQAIGIVREQSYVGDAPPLDSFDELSALFSSILK